MTLRALGETARFINGAAFKPTDWEDEGLPIIRIQNLTGTGEKFNFTTREVKPELVVEPGDLLVSWSATLDVYRWAGPRGVLNQHIFKVLPKAEIDPDYLFYALKNALAELSAKTHGSTMKHVVRGDFESTEVRMPQLAEQRRIVDILSRAEGIVRLWREAEKKAAELIPALFLGMFGDPATNPKGWPVAALGDVCMINPRLDKHQKPAADSIVSFVPMAAVDGIRGEVAIIEPRSYASVAKGFTPFIEDDVLFAKITPCMENGKAAIVPELVGGFGFGSTEFHVLRPTEHLHKAWLFGFVRRETFRQQAKLNFSGTAGQQRVPADFLKTLNVPVPDFKTQIAFAQALERIRSIQTQHSAATAKAQAAFDALRAQVFQI